MQLKVSRFGNLIKKAALNEYNIIKDSRRAGQIARSKYPDKTLAGTRVMARKLAKEVGPEPVAGLLLGLYTNPFPGFGALGYLFGRGLAEGRKALTKIIKNMRK